MPYEAAMNTLAAAIAREGPAWIMAMMLAIVAVVLLAKGLPAWTAHLGRRAAVEEERERRKARESDERSRTEGQWIQAIDRGNDVSERVAAALDSSTCMIGQVSRKLDNDERRGERNDERLDRIETNITVLLERTKQ